MQCVGTLSWSVMGLAVPAKTSAAQPSSPARRALRSRRQGQSLGAARCGAGARATREEVRPLEIDWSQVVRRCMDGDSGAWAELVRTHHRRVYGLCYRFTGNPADAEDLTQDVFLKIYSNLASFDMGRGSLQVWITTMTRNLLVDNFRRTRNQRATGSLDEGWDVDRRAAAGGPADVDEPLAARVGGARRNWQRWCRTRWRGSPWSCARP